MMNVSHQFRNGPDKIVQTYSEPIQNSDVSAVGLRPCISIKNSCNTLYFDRLPVKMTVS